MALIAEDGTGLSTANSYPDVAFADAYFALRGVTEWAALSTADKEIHLINGSEYADLRWGSLLQGRPLLSSQALEFPRSGMYDRYGNLVEGVPEDWKRACCEYALVESAGGELIPAAPSSAKEIKKKKTVVGPITTEVEYMGVELATDFIGYPKADGLARQFTVGGGVSNRVIRA